MCYVCVCSYFCECLCVSSVCVCLYACLRYNKRSRGYEVRRTLNPLCSAWNSLLAPGQDASVSFTVFLRNLTKVTYLLRVGDKAWGTWHTCDALSGRA